MPIYDFRCPQGHVTEVLVRSADVSAACGTCGRVTRRLPAAGALLGHARLPRSADQMPASWLGTHQGNRDVVTGWQREIQQRNELEARHPELASNRAPIVAHEGRYSRAPLRADELPKPAPAAPPLDRLSTHAGTDAVRPAVHPRAAGPGVP